MNDSLTAPRSGLWQRATSYLDWKANPVLLRDLRLYLRGKLLLASYFLTLTILILAGIAFALNARWRDMDGAGLLYVPTLLLCLICGALVPNLVAERFRAELRSRALELALASPLTAGRLVRGKLFGAWGLSMLVASAAAPIFATAYLLGGVTYTAILGVAGGALLAGAVMPLPQLCLAANNAKNGSRILFTLLFVTNIIIMFSYASFLYEAFVATRGYGPPMQGVLASLWLAAVLIAQFLYFVTVSRLRPEAETRDAAPRISLVAGAAAGFLGALAVYIHFEDIVLDWEEISQALTIACLPVAYVFTWGVDTLGHGNAVPPRIQGRRWADRPILRYFFGSGPRGLTALFVLSTTAILVVSTLGIWEVRSWSRDRVVLVCFTLAPLMVEAYGLVAYHYLVRPFLRRRPGPNTITYTTSITNGLLAVVIIFVMLVARGMTKSDHITALVYGTTPVGLWVSGVERTASVMPVAIVSMAVLLLLLLPVLFRRERPPEAEAGRVQPGSTM